MTHDHHGGPGTDTYTDPELQLFERQLRRFGEGGDCAYERALNTLYQRLFDQRRQQLEALHHAKL